ncbi:MAG: hypothetical protein ABSB78_08450 [Bacteroidota bacterium]
MKILLATLELETYSGVPLYTRDIALELKRQGHTPEIYTIRKGKIAQELAAADIPVTDNPAQIEFQPDIIHGQHRVSTLIAVKQFRTTPALFVCHNHTFWGDRAPFHPRILLYMGVSLECMARLKGDGVPENTISFLANFVDTHRFMPRSHLPKKPLRALVFSNYASDRTYVPAVREACLQAGLELDVVGMQANYVQNPEKILGNYDIVFAKAKAAIESMATGAAVILCDFTGVGPMVTTVEFDKLRMMNFGFQALTKSLDARNILAEIARYDPEDTIKVRDLIRKKANLEEAAINLISVYNSVINEYRCLQSNGSTIGTQASLSRFDYWERARFWAALKPVQRWILCPLAKIDPAAKEHLYISTRYSIVPFVKNSGQEVNRLPVRIWMAIPEQVRTRIRNLPITRKLIDVLEHRIITDQK